VRVPPPNLKFDHSLHRVKGVACRTCHGDLQAERVGLATRAQLPKMATCLTCHDGRTAARKCITCHLAGPGGIVRTDFVEGPLAPSGSLRGADHDLQFRRSHRAAAKNDPDYCAACHRTSFCVDCHNGVIKPMDFHGNDYVTLHAIDARRNRPDCSACHRLQSFCVGCHSRAGYADDGRGSEFLPPSSGDLTRRFHANGWVVFGPDGLQRGDDSRGATHHSFHAQRNIRQCVSCHREEFCKRCHTAEPGGHRVNPHPRTWRGSRRCRSLASRNGRVCLRCHVDAAEANCDYVGTR
jgi:hypothetical protein